MNLEEKELFLFYSIKRDTCILRKYIEEMEISEHLAKFSWNKDLATKN
jgi:hypothetical protein